MSAVRWVGWMLWTRGTTRALAATLLGTSAVICPVVGPAAHAWAESGPEWGSCAPWVQDPAAIPTAQCRTVSVPVDWNSADPQGAQAQLAVIRIPASGNRIGTLFVNPGGPGASAVNTVAGMAAALTGSPLTDHFDLVGFDPRGVGHSTPQLRCRTDAEIDAYRREPLADYSPAGVAHIEDLYRQFAQQCLDRMGAPFLANIGTASSVRDMDAVRAALGEEQINYLGFSYGTQLGAAYAEQFGDRVRTMVLDGAIDPSLDPITKNVRQLAGFQQAFEKYAADCAQSSDCPLGTDPAQFVGRYHQMVDPLVTTPAATTDSRGLGYADAITGTGNAMYSARLWPFLTSGLLGLTRGTNPGDLLLLADDYWHRDDSGHYQNMQDAFTAIRCVDSSFPTDPAAWADADRQNRAAAPFLAYGEFTGYAPRDICALWPVPATSAPHAVTGPGPGKVVVVSTTGDPATPYQAGVDLARQMDAALISFRGSQHTVVFNGDACVDTATLSFFITQSSPGDLSC
ncbi:alpha/beta fold hydrolase [Mycolicibacterium frederiksbergense]|nr:alpha/beta fold hydrolase [Mycolicibacterium frederiksbergense]